MVNMRKWSKTAPPAAVALLVAACAGPPDVSEQYRAASDATVTCIRETSYSGIEVSVSDPHPHAADARFLDWSVEAEGSPSLSQEEFVELHAQIDEAIDDCMEEHLSGALSAYIAYLDDE